MTETKLRQSTERLLKISIAYWSLIPEDVKNEIRNHTDTVKLFFTEIMINDDLLPIEWRNNDALKESLRDYLSYLHQIGKYVTTQVLKAVIRKIYIEVKGDVNRAIIAYTHSTIRNYPEPYVPEKDSEKMVQSGSMPGRDEIKSLFKEYFQGQNITPQVIQAFMDFNAWAKDVKNQPIKIAKLPYFIKDLAKLTELSIGKVFSTLKYMKAKDTLTLPVDYFIVRDWSNIQNIKL